MTRNNNHTPAVNDTVKRAAIEASLMKLLPARDVKVDSISLPPSATNTRRWVVTCFSLSQSRGCVVLVELSLFATPDTRLLSAFHL